MQPTGIPMKFTVKTTNLLNLKTQCVCLFVADNKIPSAALELDQAISGQLTHIIGLDDLDEKTGSAAWVYPNASSNIKIERILLVQLGKTENTDTNIKRAISSASKLLDTAKLKEAAIILDVASDSHCPDYLDIASHMASSMVKESYRYSYTKTSAKHKTPLQRITVCHSEKSTHSKIKQGLQTGQAVGEGVNVARELGNLPGNVCTPKYLSEQAKQLKEESENLTVQILNEKQMEKLGMGSLLSVSRGSDEEAQLIVMQYKGGAKTGKPHVLVGKGITFDTGGISLKPGAAMDEMKFDMCGAASVFGTLSALIKMKAKVNVVGIVAAAENMPSGTATKPGDVVTSMSGQTIEVLNTDAEGRLVLCDALTYAEKFKPATVIDIATLTGACVIALGSHATGLYSNNQDLANALLTAGESTQDRAWQMPLWDEYQKQLDSNFADIANIGGREAGSVTAACFLSRFTKKYKWAHLDIAGAAWNSGASKGATGRPVALLVDYLLKAK